MEHTVSLYPTTVSRNTHRVVALRQALSGDTELLDFIIRGDITDVPVRSSPGCPYFLFASRNGALVSEYVDELVVGVRARILTLCRTKFEDANEMTSLELVKHGLCDIVRLFVKNEPHSVEKLRVGRERLIMSISFVDQVVERFFCTVQNHREIETWTKNPSSPGIGFDDETNRLIFDLFREQLERGVLYTSDISGWDWCYKPWLEYADCEMRIRLAGINPSSPMANAMRVRSLCALRSVMSLSDGRLFELTYDGIMKSGRYVTSSTNSRARVLLATVIQMQCTGSPGFCRAMGDDAGESYAPGAVEAYEGVGFYVKEYVKCLTSFDFCSHRFTVDRAAPLTWAKTLFRYISHSDAERDDEMYEQLMYELRDHPGIDLISRALEAAGDRQ